jgi:hypothetical protein
MTTETQTKTQTVCVNTPDVHHTLPRHERRARRRREVTTLPRAGVLTTSPKPVAHPNRKPTPSA